MIIFHINHQLLTTKEVHFEYSIYLSLKRFYLIFDDLCRVYLNFLFVDVLLEPTHVVIPIVSEGSPSICKTLVLITLLLDVVFCLLHSNYDFLKLLFLFVFFSLKFLGFDVVADHIVRERQFFDLEVHYSPTYLDCLGLGNT